MDIAKWCRIVVKGDNVTEDQAAEIIFRTDGLNFSTNDNEWRKILYEELGIKNIKNYFPDYDEFSKIKSDLKVLDLEYLCNQQIASCYINGPHGWCSWNGEIGCDGYNIGKYPRVESVFKEWKKIAEAWPFLNLRCQLWDGEYGEDCNPVVEYIVKDGTVIVKDPENTLVYNKSLVRTFAAFYPLGERGCTLSQFKHAINLCKNK